MTCMNLISIALLLCLPSLPSRLCPSPSLLNLSVKLASFSLLAIGILQLMAAAKQLSCRAASLAATAASTTLCSRFY